MYDRRAQLGGAGASGWKASHMGGAGAPGWKASHMGGAGVSGWKASHTDRARGGRGGIERRGGSWQSMQLCKRPT